MHRLPISKIEVDSRGMLWLTPGALPVLFTPTNMVEIYRAAMSVRWDGTKFHVVPESELTTVEQVAQIAGAVEREFGAKFVRTASTEFVNLAPEVLAAAMAVYGEIK